MPEPFGESNSTGYQWLINIGKISLLLSHEGNGDGLKRHAQVLRRERQDRHGILRFWLPYLPSAVVR